MVWPVKLLLALGIASLTACSSAEKQKSCVDSCEQRFTRDLASCDRYSAHESNPRARDRLLHACLKGEGWTNGQQDCRARCQK